MSKKYRRIKKTLALTLALVMVLGILPLAPVASAAGNVWNTLVLANAADVKTAIEADQEIVLANESTGEIDLTDIDAATTVKVTGEFGGAGALALVLNNHVTINWEAKWTGAGGSGTALALTGAAGTFNVPTDGLITSNHASTATLTATAGITVNVTGGTVSATGGASAVSSAGHVNVTGGSVTATGAGNALVVSADTGSVTVGTAALTGTVTSVTGVAIHSAGPVTIIKGTITAGNATAIQTTGTTAATALVRIDDGTVTNDGTSDATIVVVGEATNDTVVDIKGGKISNINAGNAITVTNGNVEVSGGVVRSLGRAISVTGAGTVAVKGSGVVFGYGTAVRGTTASSVVSVAAEPTTRVTATESGIIIAYSGVTEVTHGLSEGLLSLPAGRVSWERVDETTARIRYNTSLFLEGDIISLTVGEGSGSGLITLTWRSDGRVNSRVFNNDDKMAVAVEPTISGVQGNDVLIVVPGEVKLDNINAGTQGLTATGWSVSGHADTLAKYDIAGLLAVQPVFNNGLGVDILKMNVIVTPNATNGKPYNNNSDADPALTYTTTPASVPGAVSFADSLQRAPGENVGRYLITDTNYAGYDNFIVRVTPGVHFNITRLPVTLSPDGPTTKPFGCEHPDSNDIIYTEAGTAPNGGWPDFTGALTRASGNSIGTYAIRLASNHASAFPNYDISFTNPLGFVFAIIKAEAQALVEPNDIPAATVELNAFEARGARTAQAVINLAVELEKLPASIDVYTDAEVYYGPPIPEYLAPAVYELGLKWTGAGSWDEKGANYTATAELEGDANVGAGSVVITTNNPVSVNVTKIEDPTPFWDGETGYILQVDNNLAFEVNAASAQLRPLLPTSGEFEILNTGVMMPFTIAWTPGATLNLSSGGGGVGTRTYTGTMTYPADWADRAPWMTMSSGVASAGRTITVTRTITAVSTLPLDFKLNLENKVYDGTPYSFDENDLVIELNGEAIPRADWPKLTPWLYESMTPGLWRSEEAPTNVITGGYKVGIGVDPTDTTKRSGVLSGTGPEFHINTRPLVFVADPVRAFIGDNEPGYTFHIKAPEEKKGLVYPDTADDIITVMPTFTLNPSTFDSTTATAFTVIPATASVTSNYHAEYERAIVTVVQGYTVGVVFGTGGGKYGAGEEVKISASIPTGKAFDRWVMNPDPVAGFFVAGSETTAEATFIMPAGNIAITATFIDAPNTFLVNVVDGTASPSRARPGETVTITATVPSGRQFISWTAGTGVVLANANSRVTTFVMPQRAVTITANLTGSIPSRPDPKPIPTTPIFTDVPRTHIAYNAIQWAAANGFVTGTNGRFDPDAIMTRESFAWTLWKYAGEPVVTSDVRFSDVNYNSATAQAIIWASSTRIVRGENNQFYPGAGVTRDSMILMFYRFHTSYLSRSGTAANVLGNFTDNGDITQIARTAMNWAASERLVRGQENKLFPREQMQRGALILILNRYDRDNGAW